MESTDWDSVSSNVEKLPYYACMLKKNTKKIKGTPADDSDWVLPGTNFDAYFGNTSFSRKWLAMIPESFMLREKQNFGVCRYKMLIQSTNPLLKTERLFNKPLFFLPIGKIIRTDAEMT